MERVSLIVAGGGSGERFRKALKSRGKTVKAASKIYLELAGLPVLVRALNNLASVKEIRETVLAVPASSVPETRAMLKLHGLGQVKVVAGGKTRALSVLNALKQTSPSNPVVLVHDGARPLIDSKAVLKLIREAKGFDGAVLASPIAATVKQVDLKNYRIEKTLDRNVLFAAETPQLARRSLLLKAYKTLASAAQATDEASLVEAAGGRVRIVTHDGWNPKITTPQDFELAEAYLAGTQKMETRTGFGRDTHRLVKGRKFWLGGLHIPHDLGPLGHSDGDALLHAVVDAILGCLCKGDIGDWFSDKSAKFKNMPSSKFVEVIMKEAAKDGWTPAHVDSVVTLERPKLGPYKKRMAARIAALLGLKASQVSVKAKTAEGLGAEGQGLAVTVEALVTMTRCCLSTEGGIR